jgi:hypothetical protein
MNPSFALVLGVRPLVIATAIVGFVALGLLLGYPLSRGLEANTRSRFRLAWVIGLAVYPSLAGMLFHVIPFTAVSLIFIVLVLAAAAWAHKSYDQVSLFETASACGPFWHAAAAVIALLPTLSIVPQPVGNGVEFGHPIFDHSKIAIVDAIAREGLPPVNPFFNGTANEAKPAGNVLVYYYGWHLTAAHARLLGATGLEAEIALTYVTALAWLCLAGWVVTALSGSTRAAWWVLAIALSAPLRTVIDFTAGPFFQGLLVPEHGLETWLIQSAWVPQHAFSTVCSVVSILFASLCMTSPPRSVVPSLVGGLAAASAYSCSVWVGGLGLAAVFAAMIFMNWHTGILKLDRRGILPIAGMFFTAAVAAGVFLAEHATLARSRSAVSFRIFPVLTTDTDLLGNVLNVIGYWTVLLPLEFGFAYIASWLAVAPLGLAAGTSVVHATRAFAVCAVVPLILASCTQSTLANNDLGWRVVLIAVFGMSVLAATYADRATRGSTTGVGFFCVVALAATLLIPSGLGGLHFVQRAGLSSRLYGAERPPAVAFVREPALWDAVQAVTLPHEVIANNPLAAAEMTPWPVNLGWALFGDRRHCAAGWELLRAYAPQLSPEEARHINEWMTSVFRGNVTEADLRMLKEQYGCATLVVVPGDGLWNHPLLDSNPYYRLVDESPDMYRLYRY